MKRILVILFSGLILIQCQNNGKTEENNIDSKMNSEISDTTMIVDHKVEGLSQLESTTDSLNIAIKGNYKIVLKRIRKEYRVFAEFDLFKINKSSWKLVQNFRIELEGMAGLDSEYLDFNNDGYNDLTFKNGVAARGANERRSLFIFDKKKDELIYIKNSENYPNIRYNAELNCIDAWLVYGGSTTLFLKIESDTLREFAGVSLMDTREVYTIDENGSRTILNEEMIHDSVVYTRYSNFKPLKINEGFK